MALIMSLSFLIGAGFEDGKLLSGFNGQIDHVMLWNRPLSNEEIAKLSGGKKEIARRDLEILGPKQPVGQYYRPRSYNMFVGDCMTFAHDGTFHVSGREVQMPVPSTFQQITNR